MVSVWILGDQLLANHPAVKLAIEEAGADQFHIVLIESWQRANRLPYQKKKLVLLFSAMRHYAAELEQKGCKVDYIKAQRFIDGLHEHVKTHQPTKLFVMASSGYHMRHYQENKLAEALSIPVEVLPNTQFLLGRYNPIPDPKPGKQHVMEYFYRDMRRHFDVLMEDEDEPAGGAWNFDKENRKPLPKDRKPPADISFKPDKITRAVMAEVEEMGHGVGQVDGFSYAVTRQEAEAAFQRFLSDRLIDFGPYEDAMTQRSHTLYHAVISPYLNIGLLDPLQCIRAAEEAYRSGRAPINSVEGFVRQILGWREFMAWQYWRQMPDMLDKNSWNAQRPVPDFFWNGETDMACLHHVITRAVETGYNHHIERLMVLSNFMMLTAINPREANEWFLSMYIDAYDWVMPPNVIGMGLNADDGLTATKPYIASANYINKMSDFCGGCRYNKKLRHGQDACPFNFLYWNFILEHEDRLRANPRLGRNVLGLRHLDDREREAVKEEAQQYLEKLQ